MQVVELSNTRGAVLDVVARAFNVRRSAGMSDTRFRTLILVAAKTRAPDARN